jgi:hypothetical protein
VRQLESDAIAMREYLEAVIARIGDAGKQEN